MENVSHTSWSVNDGENHGNHGQAENESSEQNANDNESGDYDSEDFEQNIPNGGDNQFFALDPDDQVNTALNQYNVQQTQQSNFAQNLGSNFSEQNTERQYDGMEMAHLADETANLGRNTNNNIYPNGEQMNTDATISNRDMNRPHTSETMNNTSDQQIRYIQYQMQNTNDSRMVGLNGQNDVQNNPIVAMQDNLAGEYAAQFPNGGLPHLQGIGDSQRSRTNPIGSNESPRQYSNQRIPLSIQPAMNSHLGDEYQRGPQRGIENSIIYSQNHMVATQEAGAARLHRSMLDGVFGRSPNAQDTNSQTKDRQMLQNQQMLSPSFNYGERQENNGIGQDQLSHPQDPPGYEESAQTQKAPTQGNSGSAAFLSALAGTESVDASIYPRKATGELSNQNHILNQIMSTGQGDRDRNGEKKRTDYNDASDSNDDAANMVPSDDDDSGAHTKSYKHVQSETNFLKKSNKNMEVLSSQRSLLRAQQQMNNLNSNKQSEQSLMQIQYQQQPSNQANGGKPKALHDGGKVAQPQTTREQTETNKITSAALPLQAQIISNNQQHSNEKSNLAARIVKSSGESAANQRNGQNQNEVIRASSLHMASQIYQQEDSRNRQNNLISKGYLDEENQMKQLTHLVPPANGAGHLGGGPSLLSGLYSQTVQLSNEEPSVMIKNYTSPASHHTEKTHESRTSEADPYEYLVSQLSSKIIFLQTMFKCVDMIQFHRNRQTLLKLAFENLRLNSEISNRTYISKRVNENEEQIQSNQFSGIVGAHKEIQRVDQESQTNLLQNLIKAKEKQPRVDQGSQTNLFQNLPRANEKQTRIDQGSQTDLLKALQNVQNTEAICQTDEQQVDYKSIQVSLGASEQLQKQFDSNVGSKEGSNLGSHFGASRTNQSQQDPNDVNRVENNEKSGSQSGPSPLSQQMKVLNDKEERTAGKDAQDDDIHQILDHLRDLCDIDIDQSNNEEVADINQRIQAAIQKLRQYCDQLDHLKVTLLSRTAYLDQMELSIFEREVALDTKAKEIEQREAVIDLQTENLELTVGASPSLDKSPGGASSNCVNIMERMLTLKNQSVQTQLVYAQLLEREQFADKRYDQMELQKFKNLEQVDYLERLALKKQKEIELQHKQLDERQNEIDKQQNEISARYKQQLEYPMNCLESSVSILGYIDNMYKEFSNPYIHDESGDKLSSSFIESNTVDDYQLQQFIQSDRNKLLFQKIKDMFEFGHYRLTNQGGGSSKKIEHQLIMMLGEKVKQLLKIEFEVIKLKAKNEIASKAIAQEQSIMESKMQELQKNQLNSMLIEERLKYIKTESDHLNKKYQQFLKLVEVIQQNYHVMISDLDFEGIKIAGRNSNQFKSDHLENIKTWALFESEKRVNLIDIMNKYTQSENNGNDEKNVDEEQQFKEASNKKDSNGYYNIASDDKSFVVDMFDKVDSPYGVRAGEDLLRHSSNLYNQFINNQGIQKDIKEDNVTHIVNQNQTTALPRHMQAYGTKVGEDGEATGYLSNVSNVNIVIAEQENKILQVGKKNHSFTPISLKNQINIMPRELPSRQSSSPFSITQRVMVTLGNIEKLNEIAHDTSKGTRDLTSNELQRNLQLAPSLQPSDLISQEQNNSNTYNRQGNNSKGPAEAAEGTANNDVFELMKSSTSDQQQINRGRPIDWYPMLLKRKEFAIEKMKQIIIKQAESLERAANNLNEINQSKSNQKQQLFNYSPPKNLIKEGKENEGNDNGDECAAERKADDQRFGVNIKHGDDLQARTSLLIDSGYLNPNGPAENAYNRKSAMGSENDNILNNKLLLQLNQQNNNQNQINKMINENGNLNGAYLYYDMPQPPAKQEFQQDEDLGDFGRTGLDEEAKRSTVSPISHTARQMDKQLNNDLIKNNDGINEMLINSRSPIPSGRKGAQQKSNNRRPQRSNRSSLSRKSAKKDKNAIYGEDEHDPKPRPLPGRAQQMKAAPNMRPKENLNFKRYSPQPRKSSIKREKAELPSRSPNDAKQSYLYEPNDPNSGLAPEHIAGLTVNQITAAYDYTDKKLQDIDNQIGDACDSAKGLQKSKLTEMDSDKLSQLVGQLQQKEMQLTILQKNLAIEKDYIQELRDHLNEQIEQVSQQREDLKMLETDINQQKLKMLIKFDKIKFLEDYYNQSQINNNKDSKPNLVRLDIELDKDELFKQAEQYYLNYTQKLLIQENQKYWPMNTMREIFKYLVKKRLQTPENKLRYSFYIFRLQSMLKATQIEITTRNNQMTIAQKLIHKREIETMRKNPSRYNIVDISSIDNNGTQLENIKWNKVAKLDDFILPQDIATNQYSQKVQEIGEGLVQDAKKFQRFKEKTLLGLMFLHYRRRARLLLYFAFQRYKTQVYKDVIGDLVQKQDLAIPGSAGAISGAIVGAQTQIQDASFSERSSGPRFEKRNSSQMSVQDQMLDEVFGQNQDPREQDSEFVKARDQHAIVPNQVPQGPLTSKIRNELHVKKRMRSLLITSSILKTKRDCYLNLHKSFQVWKDTMIKSNVEQLAASNRVHMEEIIQLKLGHKTTMMQFNLQKQEFEAKLQKIAQLIQDKIVEQNI